MTYASEHFALNRTDPMTTRRALRAAKAQLALPMPEPLARAVAVPPPADPVALMEHLRALDRMLAGYGRELDAALEEATLDVFHRLAGPKKPMDGAVAR